MLDFRRSSLSKAVAMFTIRRNDTSLSKRLCCERAPPGRAAIWQSLFWNSVFCISIAKEMNRIEGPDDDNVFFHKPLILEFRHQLNHSLHSLLLLEYCLRHLQCRLLRCYRRQCHSHVDKIHRGQFIFRF